uniref:Uncharacterized protein n=1 Tax=viral metagenome TaxID=1070528 RepID=A0A6M3LI63_9ZZZZ
MPDIKMLNQIGEFLTVYGGWGVSIFLSIFIMYLFKYFGKKLRQKDAEIKERDMWWKGEREKINATFEKHREENLKVIERFTRSIASIGNKMGMCRDESRDTCQVLQRLLDAISGGIIKLKKHTQAEIDSITQFFNNGNGKDDS